MSDTVSAVLLIKDISVLKNWSNKVSYFLNYCFFLERSKYKVSALDWFKKKNCQIHKKYVNANLSVKARALSF